MVRPVIVDTVEITSRLPATSLSRLLFSCLKLTKNGWGIDENDESKQNEEGDSEVDEFDESDYY